MSRIAGADSELERQALKEMYDSRSTTRMYGVDVARTIAIVGMVMVHFGPFPPPDTFSGQLYGITQGRASVLFALLAGLSIALASGGNVNSVEANARTGQRRVKLILRAAMLLPLGLWLQQLDHDALVILQYYALYFVLAAALLGVADRYLLRGTAAVLVLGPVIYLLVQLGAPGWFSAPPATLGDSPGKVAHDLLISGAYPLVTWAAPLLFGIWLGRTNLTSVTVRRRLLVCGAAAALGAALVSSVASALISSNLQDGEPGTEIPAFLLTNEPHSQSIIWMAGSIGSACMVLGSALIVAGFLPRLTWPLAATGQLALTVYVTHLIAIDLTGGLLQRSQILPAAATVAAFMAVAAMLSVLWRRFGKRGPLEALLAAPWWLLQRLFELHAGSGKAHGGSRAQDTDYTL